MPRVSVIMPAYNRADLIHESIKSVLDQTFKDFELIIINDGSTDNTLSVVESFASDSRVVIINQPNVGEGGARNTGLAAAQGDFIGFLDSDDLWLPKKLELQIELIDNSDGLEWVYSDTEVFDSDTGKTTHLFSNRNPQKAGNVSKNLILNCFIASPTPLVARHIFEEVGSFSDFKIAADWDMWLRISAKYKLGRIREPLARYRVHAGSVTLNKSVDFRLQKHLEVIDRAFNFAPKVFGSKAVAYAVQYKYFGRQLLSNNFNTEARAMFSQAIKVHPYGFASYLWWLGTFLGKSFWSRVVNQYGKIRNN